MGSSSDPNQSNIDGAFTGSSATGRNISFPVFISPIPVATRSKVWVWGCLLTGIVGSKLGGMNICLLLGFWVCCRVEFSAAGWSLVQRNPTCFECDLRFSTMRRLTLSRAVERRRKVCNTLPSLKKYKNIFRNWFIFIFSFDEVLQTKLAFYCFLLSAVFNKTNNNNNNIY
jgi:hypothetical protein